MVTGGQKWCFCIGHLLPKGITLSPVATWRHALSPTSSTPISTALVSIVQDLVANALHMADRTSCTQQFANRRSIHEAAISCELPTVLATTRVALCETGRSRDTIYSLCSRCMRASCDSSWCGTAEPYIRSGWGRRRAVQRLSCMGP